jgi:deoxyribodipyrimidine photolyase-related protein
MHKMSDYCKSCYYDRKVKHGERACPFNSLYWDFYARNRDKLGKNPRVAQMYRLWDRMSESEQAAIRTQASEYRKRLDEL